MNVVVVLTVETVEEPHPVDGLCPGCWLPSLASCTFAIHGPHTTHVVSPVACVDCGATVR